MKRILETLMLTFFIVLATVSFGYAQYIASDAGNFPYFHLGCLVMGGLTIVSLKQRYQKIYLSEAIGSFALYAILVALFTAPVIDTLKAIIS
jgi:hypothetical protein